MKHKSAYIKFILTYILLFSAGLLNGESGALKIDFIDYYFENGSPLLWKIENDTLCVSLLPDYQRETLNRQTDHWYFRIVAEKGTRIRMKIEKMVPDVYNGRPATDWWNYKTGIPCYISNDNSSWKPYRTTTLPGKEIFLEFVMDSDEVYLARLPVYTTSDLKSLISGVENKKGIKIIEIGRTLENRPLEIIRLGTPDAKIQVLIRARAHPWEAGGNWVIEGLIDEFIKKNNKVLSDNFCFSILPMANIDGVVRGMTRFNTAGMDLNRNWDKAPDSLLCPENYAFDAYINGLISQGLKPVLIIDLHNDDKGDIHLAKHDRKDVQFKNDMKRFERLLRKYTSFSEEFRYSWNDDGQEAVMSIENGILQRYGLESFVYELNANWISGLTIIPSADNWKETGKGLFNALYDFLR